MEISIEDRTNRIGRMRTVTFQKNKNFRQVTILQMTNEEIATVTSKRRNTLANVK